MLFDLFMKATQVEAKTNVIARDLAKYVNHGHFTDLRMQIATAKKLRDEHVEKLTKEEYAALFPSNSAALRNTITAFKAYKAKEERIKFNASSKKDEADKIKGDKPEGQKPKKEEQRTIYIPTERELIMDSDLWAALSCAINQEQHFNLSRHKHLCKHVEESILHTLEFELEIFSDRRILTDIASTIAQASALH